MFFCKVETLKRDLIVIWNANNVFQSYRVSSIVEAKALYEEILEETNECLLIGIK